MGKLKANCAFCASGSLQYTSLAINTICIDFIDTLPCGGTFKSKTVKTQIANRLSIFSTDINQLIDYGDYDVCLIGVNHSLCRNVTDLFELRIEKPFSRGIEQCLHIFDIITRWYDHNPFLSCFESSHTRFFINLHNCIDTCMPTQ